MNDTQKLKIAEQTIAQMIRELAALRAERDALKAALDAAIIQRDGDVFYRTRGDVPMEIPKNIARKIRAALDAGAGKGE